MEEAQVQEPVNDQAPAQEAVVEAVQEAPVQEAPVQEAQVQEAPAPEAKTPDRKSTRLNSSHPSRPRMPSSA